MQPAQTSGAGYTQRHDNSTGLCDHDKLPSTQTENSCNTAQLLAEEFIFLFFSLKIEAGS